MCNVQVSVFALMATVSTDGSVTLSWTTVVSTLLLTLLHCCGSIPTPPVVNEAGATPTRLLEMRAATSHLERAAGAALAETGDAVQVVGGDGLVLLLDEAEGREVEAGLLTLPVLQHGGELFYGAPFNRRRTSQLPHLHMDTYRQCINGRKVGRWNQNAPTGLISSWAAISMLVCFQGLKLKKKKVKISSWTATLQGLGEMFRLGGNSQVIGRAVWEDWRDLRDKQVKGGGVGRLRIDRGVTPVQQDKVPVKREWGPRHRVRDSRSQVESSRLQSYQGPFVRLLQTVRDGKARFTHFTHSVRLFLNSSDLHSSNGWEPAELLSRCANTATHGLTTTHGDGLIPQVVKCGVGRGLVAEGLQRGTDCLTVSVVEMLNKRPHLTPSQTCKSGTRTLCYLSNIFIL